MKKSTGNHLVKTILNTEMPRWFDLVVQRTTNNQVQHNRKANRISNSKNHALHPCWASLFSLMVCKCLRLLGGMTWKPNWRICIQIHNKSNVDIMFHMLMVSNILCVYLFVFLIQVVATTSLEPSDTIKGCHLKCSTEFCHS